MFADAVNHLVNANRLELLSLCCSLVENLGMKVVEVVTGILICFTKKDHNVDALFEL
jgi:hypothetical protein